MAQLERAVMGKMDRQVSMRVQQLKGQLHDHSTRLIAVKIDCAFQVFRRKEPEYGRPVSGSGESGGGHRGGRQILGRKEPGRPSDEPTPATAAPYAVCVCDENTNSHLTSARISALPPAQPI